MNQWSRRPQSESETTRESLEKLWSFSIGFVPTTNSSSSLMRSAVAPTSTSSLIFVTKFLVKLSRQLNQPTRTNLKRSTREPLIRRQANVNLNCLRSPKLEPSCNQSFSSWCERMTPSWIRCSRRPTMDSSLVSKCCSNLSSLVTVLTIRSKVSAWWTHTWRRTKLDSIRSSIYSDRVSTPWKTSSRRVSSATDFSLNSFEISAPSTSNSPRLT